MSKPRRLTINPAKLRAAIDMSLAGEAIDANKMNVEEATLFRLIMSGVNDPFEGKHSVFCREVKNYLIDMEDFNEQS